jgi:Asp-tRNA(Asn)/Glu-tRNA(Gln) amidotransferase A subunit family amidase
MMVVAGIAMGQFSAAADGAHELKPGPARCGLRRQWHRLAPRLVAACRPARRVPRTFDLLLTPTLAEPPARLGRFAMNNPDFIDYRLGPNGLWRYTPFTPLANATGAPSISLPAGLSSTVAHWRNAERPATMRCCCRWRSGRPRRPARGPGPRR